MFDYNVGLNEIVQLVIRTVPPPGDNNNSRKQTQKEVEKSTEKSTDSPLQVNGHVPNDNEVLLPVKEICLNAVSSLLSLWLSFFVSHSSSM